MKNVRKILPALAMLVVSAVMLSTASFAWFAMSTTADATGMSVTLKSDSQYLLIADAANASNIQTLNSNTATGTELTNAITDGLAPVAHNTYTQGSTNSTIVENTSTKNWYTMEGTSVDQNGYVGVITGGADNDGKTYISSIDGYVAHWQYVVAMADGSSSGYNFRLSDVASLGTGGGATDKNPISVIIVCGENFVELNQDNSWTSSEVLSTEIKAGENTTVDVYVYYDGNNASVYTNNAEKIADVTVGLKFVVDSSST